MEIFFKDRTLAKLLNSEDKLREKYNAKTAEAFMERMFYLKAAPSLNDVSTSKPYRRHKLKGKRKEQFAICVDRKLRIVFSPNHDPWPMKEDGTTLDFKRVTSIIILDEGDYHE